jgi:hypothetical protein
MYATHPHPRRALLAAAAALALALSALMPAAVDDASFSLGADRSAPAQAPVSAPATPRSEPQWQDNPFAFPLLQVPQRGGHSM